MFRQQNFISDYDMVSYTKLTGEVGMSFQS